jgi:hypothetical protein
MTADNPANLRDRRRSQTAATVAGLDFIYKAPIMCPPADSLKR